MINKKQFSNQWLIISGVCVFFGLLLTVREYLLGVIWQARKFSFGQIILEQFPYWLFWAALSAIVMLLARRFPFRRAQAFRSFSAHLLAGVILASVFPITYSLLNLWAIYTPDYNNIYPQRGTVQFLFIIVLTLGVFVYWGILLIALTLERQSRFEDEMLLASQLKAQLVEARLLSLKMQLYPHFLFNALHSVTALVLKKDTRGAVDMIQRVGDLLRRALQDTEKQMIPLKQEIEFIEQYLGIEQIRFRDRLTVNMKIDPKAFEAEVPNLILQPLVENAIRHAITPHSTAGLIEIVAKREGKNLRLAICDDGPGLPENWSEAENSGIGLKNTRLRLAHLYSDYEFAVRNRFEGGTMVSMLLPFGSNGNQTTETETQ